MINARAFRQFSEDPSAFRAHLCIDTDGVPRSLGDVLDDWQRRDFSALDPAWLRCIGHLSPQEDAPRMRAYLERPRGHSKTNDLAVMCSWALAFAMRPLRGFAFAADKDQARLLRDAILTLTRLNPWLGQIIEVRPHKVVNVADGHPGCDSSLEIVASDVGSSYGLLADFVIVDELTHWKDDDALWGSIISTAAKRSNCLLVCISNAGYEETWQWRVREAVRSDPGWYFSRLAGPHASWITEDRLDEQRRMLPPVAFDRLWMNLWSSGGGDALRRDDIDAAFKADLAPMYGRSVGYSFVAGVDLGVSRDASSVVVLGIQRGHRGDGVTLPVASSYRFRLAHVQLWQPGNRRSKRINLEEVEDCLDRLHRRYRFNNVNYDPYQAEHLAQRLRRAGIPMRETTFTGANLQAMATATIESFTDRRMDLYPHEQLRRDLLRLRVEERSYGFRLVSPRDATGHGDSATALCLALLAANREAARRRIYLGPFAGDEPVHDVSPTRRWDFGEQGPAPDQPVRISTVSPDFWQ